MTSATYVLDAGVLIGFLETADSHNAAATSALRRLIKRGARLVVSSATYSEVLVEPMRRGPAWVQRAEAGLRHLPGFELVDVDVDIARRAAYRRAETAGLRLPDALVVSTADLQKAEAVLTTDQRLARIEGVQLIEEFAR